MSLLQDVQYGVRLLAKARGFTGLAVATLALGIGAVSTIFSVVDAVVIRSLPFREPDRVLVIWEQNPSLNGSRLKVAVGNFLEWRRQARSFEDMAGLQDVTANLTAGPNGRIDPEELKVERISASAFPLLGVEPVVGRVFRAEEDQPGKGNFAVLSHSLWARKFASDPAIPGKTIRLRNQTYTVLGVMPAGFAILDPAVDVYVPLALNASDARVAAARMLMVLARLKPGVSVGEAKNEMAIIGGRLEESNPAVNRGWRPSVFTIQNELLGNIQQAMLVLLGAVGLLQLMACANVANLLLARGATRRREIAVRAAVGAGRVRLIRQFLAESLLLAGAGGVLGLLLARGGVAVVSRLGPASIPRLYQTRLDARLLLFTFAVTMLTGILFGIAPAVQGSRANVHAALLEVGRGGTSGRSGRFLRSALVVVEIALAVVVLIGDGLLLRSFERLRSTDLGFQPAHVLTFRLPLAGGRNTQQARRIAFVQQVLQRTAALPGVTAAGAVSVLPLTGFGSGAPFVVEGSPAPAPGQLPVALLRAATPDYFRAMGTPLVAGRLFGDGDTADSPRVIIIDQALARHFFPGRSPIGSVLRIMDANERTAEIVGVVGTMKPERIETMEWPTIYVPYPQAPDATVAFAVQVRMRRLPGAATIERMVHDLDPEQPVSAVRPMSRIVEEAQSGARFNTVALTIFAVIAFALAAVGIYGVISYDVAARTHEMGIRMALGADGRHVRNLVMRQGAILAGAGIAAGLACALAITRLMASMLYGVDSRDVYTFAAIALLLGIVALAACYLPTRRVTALDPLPALRHDEA
jgi:putative ABC transport system permease protein